MDHRVAIVQPPQQIIDGLIRPWFAVPFRRLLHPVTEHDKAKDEETIPEKDPLWRELGDKNRGAEDQNAYPNHKAGRALLAPDISGISHDAHKSTF
jgi:hypothetical protein